MLKKNNLDDTLKDKNKMVFYKLKVGNYEIRYTPLKAEVREFPFCDKDGNLLKKVIPPKPAEMKTFFVDNAGNSHAVAFRLIKGQARAKLSKTKEVNNFIEVKNSEVEDLLTEKFYVCDCALLLEKLQKERKALKFGYTAGNGYKVYLAYLHTSELYPDLLFMSLGQAQKSKLITEIVGQMKNQEKKRIVEQVVMGVNKASVDELLEIA